MNIVLKNQLKWPKGIEMVDFMDGFKDFCGLPLVHGAINATQTHLQKPMGQHFTIDYYFLKGYNSSNFKQLWIIGDDLVMSSLIFLVL
jgi:hypothetical protein